MTQKYCPRCGVVNQIDAKQCPACGEMLGAVRAPEVEMRRRKMALTFWIAAMCLVAFFVVVGIIGAIKITNDPAERQAYEREHGPL